MRALVVRAPRPPPYIVGWADDGDFRSVLISGQDEGVRYAMRRGVRESGDLRDGGDVVVDFLRGDAVGTGGNVVPEEDAGAGGVDQEARVRWLMSGDACEDGTGGGFVVCVGEVYVLSGLALQDE